MKRGAIRTSSVLPQRFAWSRPQNEAWEAHNAAARGPGRKKQGRQKRSDGVALALRTCCERFQPSQKRAARIGFRNGRRAPGLDKIAEETQPSLERSSNTVDDQRPLEDEVGDLIFASTTLAQLELDPKTAVRRARTVEGPFRRVEARRIGRHRHHLEALESALPEGQNARNSNLGKDPAPQKTQLFA